MNEQFPENVPRVALPQSPERLQRSIRVARAFEGLRNYVPHNFVPPEYDGNPEEFVRTGRQIIEQAVSERWYDTRQVTRNRMSRHGSDYRFIRTHASIATERRFDQNGEYISSQAKDLTTMLTARSTIAIVHTAFDAAKRQFRERLEAALPQLPRERWRLAECAMQGSIRPNDIARLREVIVGLEKPLIMPDFFQLANEQKCGIIDNINEDAAEVARFADSRNLLHVLASLKTNVIVRPVSELFEMSTQMDDARALKQYFTLGSSSHPRNNMELHPLTSLKPGESVRFARSQVMQQSLQERTRQHLLAVANQIHNASGSYVRPEVFSDEWTQNDPVKKLGRNFYGNFRHTVLHALPADEERTRALVPFWQEETTPQEHTRRFLLTVNAKWGMNQVTRGVEAMVYTRQTAGRAILALACGGLIENSELLDTIIAHQKVIGDISAQYKGMMVAPAGHYHNRGV